jgi:Periplasmic binding protein
MRFEPYTRRQHDGDRRENRWQGLARVRHPINVSDFSPFLLQAQGSKAKVIGLANAGGDTINAVKQASEFDIVKGGQKLAGLLIFISDIHTPLFIHLSHVPCRLDKCRSYSHRN